MMGVLAPSAAELIGSHVPCTGCGYDLYASRRSGVCPECGKTVAASVSASDLFSDIGNAVDLRRMGLTLLVSSIFAGLCPGACMLAVQGESLGGAVAMSIAFATCGAFAAAGEFRRRKVFGASGALTSPGSPWVADCIAAGGLLLINVAAYAYAIERSHGFGTMGSEQVVMALVAIGFFLLCVTAWRALPTWRTHAEIVGLLGGTKLSKFFHFLAWTKAIYETIWLFCCWAPFAFIALGRPFEDLGIGIAFAALFGLVGFSAIWIMMIIAHAILLAQLRKATEPAISCANT